MNLIIFDFFNLHGVWEWPEYSGKFMTGITSCYTYVLDQQPLPSKLFHSFTLIPYKYNFEDFLGEGGNPRIKQNFMIFSSFFSCQIYANLALE